LDTTQWDVLLKKKKIGRNYQPQNRNYCCDT